MRISFFICFSGKYSRWARTEKLEKKEGKTHLWTPSPPIQRQKIGRPPTTTSLWILELVWHMSSVSPHFFQTCFFFPRPIFPGLFFPLCMFQITLFFFPPPLFLSLTISLKSCYRHWCLIIQATSARQEGRLRIATVTCVCLPACLCPPWVSSRPVWGNVSFIKCDLSLGISLNGSKEFKKINCLSHYLYNHHYHY